MTRDEVPSLESLPDAMTVDEAGAFLRVGRNGIYGLIRRGEVPAIRMGRRLLVSKRVLARLLDGEGAEPIPAAAP